MLRWEVRVAEREKRALRVVTGVDELGPVVWLLDDSTGRYLRLDPGVSGEPVESVPWEPAPPRQPLVWHPMRTWFTTPGRLVIVPSCWEAFWVPLVPEPPVPFDLDTELLSPWCPLPKDGWTVFVEAA